MNDVTDIAASYSQTADMLKLEIAKLHGRIAELEAYNAALKDKLDSFQLQLGLWGWEDANKTMLQAMQDGVAGFR